MPVLPQDFALHPTTFKPLAVGFGACLATNMIIVDGQKVAFCYREEPDNSIDSGWRFFAGGESEEYMEDAANAGVYDINTLANYDPEITQFLDAPPGSAFEREGGVGRFVQVYDFEPRKD